MVYLFYVYDTDSGELLKSLLAHNETECVEIAKFLLPNNNFRVKKVKHV